MTRTFVVTAHEAAADDFSLDDLSGEGRLDLLCRCVNAAFLTSHGLRRDVELYLVLRDAALWFRGSDLRGLNPDERSIAGLLRNAFRRRGDAVGRQWVEASPGVGVSQMGFEGVLEDVDGSILELHSDGVPLTDVAPPSNPVFVLSDHRDFTMEEQEVLETWRDERVRLGPRTLHTDHAVSVAHNWLDTDGYTSY